MLKLLLQALDERILYDFYHILILILFKITQKFYSATRISLFCILCVIMPDFAAIMVLQLWPDLLKIMVFFHICNNHYKKPYFLMKKLEKLLLIHLVGQMNFWIGLILKINKFHENYSRVSPGKFYKNERRILFLVNYYEDV